MTTKAEISEFKLIYRCRHCEAQLSLLAGGLIAEHQRPKCPKCGHVWWVDLVARNQEGELFFNY